MKEYLENFYDLYNLYARIKEIDRNYRLVFNKKNKRAEVHNFSQRGTSFVMVAEPLDARLILKLKQTRVENSHQFLKELDEYNANLQIKQQQQVLDRAKDINCEIANYSFIKNQNLTSEEIHKIINI